jgi:hypothetical protein
MGGDAPLLDDGGHWYTNLKQRFGAHSLTAKPKSPSSAGEFLMKVRPTGDVGKELREKLCRVEIEGRELWRYEHPIKLDRNDSHSTFPGEQPAVDELARRQLRQLTVGRLQPTHWLFVEQTPTSVQDPGSCVGCGGGNRNYSLARS